MGGRLDRKPHRTQNPRGGIAMQSDNVVKLRIHEEKKADASAQNGGAGQILPPEFMTVFVAADKAINLSAVNQTPPWPSIYSVWFNYVTGDNREAKSRAADQSARTIWSKFMVSILPVTQSGRHRSSRPTNVWNANWRMCSRRSRGISTRAKPTAVHSRGRHKA